MPKKAAALEAVEEGRRPVKVQYTLEERQVTALRAESLRRAAERPRGRPDASEVLREIVDAWLTKGGKR